MTKLQQINLKVPYKKYVMIYIKRYQVIAMKILNAYLKNSNGVLN